MMDSIRLRIYSCYLLLFIITCNIAQCQTTRYPITNLSVFPKIILISSANIMQESAPQDLMLHFNIKETDINSAKFFVLQIFDNDEKRIIEKKFKVNIQNGNTYLKNKRELVPFINDRISLNLQIPIDNWVQMKNLKLWFVDSEKKSSNILEFSFVKVIQ